MYGMCVLQEGEDQGVPQRFHLNNRKNRRAIWGHRGMVGSSNTHISIVRCLLDT